MFDVEVIVVVVGATDVEVAGDDVTYDAAAAAGAGCGVAALTDSLVTSVMCCDSVISMIDNSAICEHVL